MPKYPDCWETCGSCGAGEVLIEQVMVRPGDVLKPDDYILILETGKTALEIPSPYAGTVVEVFVEEGDEPEEGQLLLILEAER